MHYAMTEMHVKFRDSRETRVVTTWGWGWGLLPEEISFERSLTGGRGIFQRQENNLGKGAKVSSHLRELGNEKN